MENQVLALVTGASGWLGKGLVNALIHGIEGAPHCPIVQGKVRVLLLPHDDDTFFKQFEKKVEVFRGDIRNLSDCKAFVQDVPPNAVLYHTAGIIHPKKVSEFEEINVVGTENILTAVISHDINKAIVVSSNSPIGCNPTSDHRFNEESPFNPYMGYGHSKMLMEKMILRMQATTKAEIVRIRAPWFYGPFQPDRQTTFFEMIRDGKGPIVGDGRNMRSMAYIDNLAQGLILAGNTLNQAGQVYWIADERAYSMNEVIDTIENVLEQDFGIKCAHKRMHLPSFASDVAYWFDKVLQKLGIYHQKIHVLSEMNKTIACSVEKAKSELGYKPTVELREGMRRSIAWMKSNGINMENEK